MMEKIILSRLEPQGLGFKVLIQANWHPGMLKFLIGMQVPALIYSCSFLASIVLQVQWLTFEWDFDSATYHGFNYPKPPLRAQIVMRERHLYDKLKLHTRDIFGLVTIVNR